MAFGLAAAHDGEARRLNARWVAARRRSSCGRGRMGVSRRSACTRGNHRGKNVPRSGLLPLPGRARRVGHGGARVGVHGGGKKTWCPWPTATYESTRPRRRRGHTKIPKGLTSFPCSCVHSASCVTKATTARQAGRRGAWRKVTEPKARPWPPKSRARACGGAQLCNGARDITSLRARACRRLGHGGGRERRCTTRRPKEPRGRTKHYVRAARTAAAPARRIYPA
jgi:hypothetical protein